ncbi:MAG TPA: hypothetical protein VFE88_03430 [Candidatus Nanoarchaeia archaeon]|nr:hypothetical protein [Candidatus Nanoarchaeia archaeon]
MKKDITDKERNRKERLAFVERWGDYVRSSDDKVWSSQQAFLINAQMESAKRYGLSAKEYLRLKEEVAKKMKELEGF